MIEIPDAKSIVKPPPVVKLALDDTLNVADISETPNLVYPPIIAILVFAAIKDAPSKILVPSTLDALVIAISEFAETRKTPDPESDMVNGIAALPVTASPTAYPYSQ